MSSLPTQALLQSPWELASPALIALQFPAMDQSCGQIIAPREVTIYTDGAASPNPGRGGYGVVIIHNGTRQELSGGFRATTNNRMELMGAIAGLRALPSLQLQDGQKMKVTLYSDAKYVVDMFNGGHAVKWRQNGWMRNKGKDKACNSDQWDELLSLAEQHDVSMVWVKGHSSNLENAHCDELAVAARQADDLPPDEGYETPAVPTPAQSPHHQQALFDWLA